jgi:alanine-synthesizing transaminase
VFSDRTAWNLTNSKLSEVLAAHRAAGRPLIDLTVSNPTECGFTYRAEEILRALGNAAGLRYEPVAAGLVSAREAVAEYYRSAHGVDVAVEDLFLTTSTSEAYSFVLRMLCNVGDEVLVPQPGYPLLEYLAGLSDVELKRYPLVYDHGWQMDFPSLEGAITAKTRAVAVVHPNNPTGHFCSDEEMERLSALCAERGLAIVADEVFLDFSLSERRVRSFAAGGGKALRFTMSGLSKIAGLPQMKVAWVAVSGPEELKRQARARLEVIADTYLSMNTPVQIALPALLEQRGHFHSQWLARAKKNLERLDGLLAAQKLCSRLEVEGGWYVVVRVPVMGGDDELAAELITEKGVFVHPGHFYEFSGDGFVVVSLICPEKEFGEGVEKLLGLFREK